MKIYKWKTSIGCFDSFDNMIFEYTKRTISNISDNIQWYQAVERKDDSELTIIKYQCPLCENIVVGIIPINYNNGFDFKNLSNIEINNLTLCMYDIFPETYMLEKNYITKNEMNYFADNPSEGLRDFDIAFKEESEIYSIFKNDFNIYISRPILDLTHNINKKEKTELTLIGCLKQKCNILIIPDDSNKIMGILEKYECLI